MPKSAFLVIGAAALVQPGSSFCCSKPAAFGYSKPVGCKPQQARRAFVVAQDKRPRSPEDEDFDATVDIPEGAKLEDIRPKGISSLLQGLPWWFPLAVGWILAPALPESPLAQMDIFTAPTAQQERQILREERALVSDRIEAELYPSR